MTSGLSGAVDSVGSVGNTASAAQTLTDAAESAASAVASVGEDITSAANRTLVNAVDAALPRSRADYPDFLIVGLWSYCNGSFDGSHTPIVTNCSTPSTTFWFNFAGALGLDSSWVASIFPSALQDAIDYYHKFTNWMISAWIITVVSTVAVLLAGLTAFGSRWGSLITSFCAVSKTAMFSSFAATLTACLIYASLVGGLELLSSTLGIHASIGWKVVILASVATFLAFAGGIFWLMSVCCCSGRSMKNRSPEARASYSVEPGSQARTPDGQSIAHGREKQESKTTFAWHQYGVSTSTKKDNIPHFETAHM
ncbi:hypothetical protein IFM51744_09286 [Aspergillus udagawae]|nr:hypothetical protein IFM51744_09286 [Aspergillus udagawae]